MDELVEFPQQRVSVVLSPQCAYHARAMASELDVDVPEVVRKGLSYLRMHLDLEDGEYLAIVRPDGWVERIGIPGMPLPERPRRRQWSPFQAGWRRRR